MHNNIVEDNTNTGVYFSSAANNNDLDHNRVCGNSLDISDADANSGDDSFCGTTSNSDDTGATGCTFSCLFGDIDIDGDVNYGDLVFTGNYLKTSASMPNVSEFLKNARLRIQRSQ